MRKSSSHIKQGYITANSLSADWLAGDILIADWLARDILIADWLAGDLLNADWLTGDILSADWLAAWSLRLTKLSGTNCIMLANKKKYKKFNIEEIIIRLGDK